MTVPGIDLIFTSIVAPHEDGCRQKVHLWDQRNHTEADDDTSLENNVVSSNTDLSQENHKVRH